jgi:TetR/AcrR family transcriptional repressor of nem operon
MGQPAEAHPTRQRLVDAAMLLFWRDGYQSTSVAAILAEAGVNAGSMYWFFPTKQDLLVAVLDRYLEGIVPMLLEPVWKAHADPIDRVFGLLRVYRRSIVETHCTYGCPIGNLAIEIADPDPIVREKIRANFDQWIAAVEECLTAARDRFPPETDLHDLATYVLTTMEGAVMQARAQRNVAPFDASVARLRDYFDRLFEASAREQLVDPSNEKGTRT